MADGQTRGRTNPEPLSDDEDFFVPEVGKEQRFRSRVQKYSNSTSVSGYVFKVKCGLSENHADFEKFPQEPLFEPKEEVYVEANGRTEGPYVVESVTLDCKYTLKLKSDGTIRRNVLEKDLRELDT